MEIRKMAKRQSRQSVQSTMKIKTAVSLSPAAVKRLNAAVAYEDRNQSELIESLILAAYGAYRVVIDPRKNPVQVISDTVTDSAKEGHEITPVAQVA